MLTERLSGLEAKGFICRECEPIIRPSETYDITKRMKDIEWVFDDLQQVALKWQKEGELARTGEKDWGHKSALPA